MPVVQHGWATTVTADLYFADERQVITFWAALADADAKNKVLNNAYNRIYYSDAFSVPAKGAETPAQLVILTKAQCEMAYYILQHLEDEDRRKGIQVQAVVAAGVVKESYNKDAADTLAIPPFIKAILVGFAKYKSPFHVIEIDRDEDESVDTNVSEF